MYIDKIIVDLIKLDKEFISNKNYGKISVEINYQNGKYICDYITPMKASKRS